MLNSTSALLRLSLKKTFYNLRSISNKVSLFINQNWFVIILPVLRLKLLLICPGHIYFVSLEFLHIFTPLRLQTSACNSCWHCELLGYMKADKSGMALSYLFDALSALPKSIDLFPEILVPPYDTVMLISATSVFLPKYTANCGSVAFLRLLWWTMTALKTFITVMYMTVRKGQERFQPWSTRKSKCKVSQAGNLGSAMLIPSEMAWLAFLRRKTEYIWEKKGWSTAWDAGLHGDLVSVYLAYMTWRHSLYILILGQTTFDLQHEWQRKSSFPSMACAGETELGSIAAVVSQASASAG